MDRKTYPVDKDVLRLNYYFLSVGPKGSIKKTIRFVWVVENLYNLSFGDWNELLGTISDTARTNNNDRDIVLSTVGSVVLDFLKYYPQAKIYARGSSPARTRLYQMSIKANWSLISLIVNVKGNFKGEWELFEVGKNYDAFMVTGKDSV